MDAYSWRNAVLDVVRRVSDESYQREAWFGGGVHISSPEEIYCELFDDFIYDDFLTSTDVRMTDLQRALGVMLRDALNQYADSVEYIGDSEKVFNDPKWNSVRSFAKNFLDAF